jgi:hypothetical protein
MNQTPSLHSFVSSSPPPPYPGTPISRLAFCTDAEMFTNWPDSQCIDRSTLLPPAPTPERRNAINGKPVSPNSPAPYSFPANSSIHNTRSPPGNANLPIGVSSPAARLASHRQQNVHELVSFPIHRLILPPSERPPRRRPKQAAPNSYPQLPVFVRQTDPFASSFRLPFPPKPMLFFSCVNVPIRRSHHHGMDHTSARRNRLELRN